MFNPSMWLDSGWVSEVHTPFSPLQDAKSVVEAIEKPGTESDLFSIAPLLGTQHSWRQWCRVPICNFTWDPGDEMLWGTLQVQLSSAHSAHRVLIHVTYDIFSSLNLLICFTSVVVFFALATVYFHLPKDAFLSLFCFAWEVISWQLLFPFVIWSEGDFCDLLLMAVTGFCPAKRQGWQFPLVFCFADSLKEVCDKSVLPYLLRLPCKYCCQTLLYMSTTCTSPIRRWGHTIRGSWIFFREKMRIWFCLSCSFWKYFQSY